MLLTDFVTKDRIILNLKSIDKDGVILELSKHLHSLGIINEVDSFVKKIMAREEIESTGIGDGVALPHARDEEVKEIAVVLGKSEKGIDFNSIDKKPVNLIFMIAAPNDIKKEYLQVIAKIARLLKTKNYMEELLNAKNVNEVMRIFYSFDDKFPKEMEVKTKNGRAVYRSQKK